MASFSNSRGADRRSPPTSAAQSKRDRKRQVLLDRLAVVSDKVARDRDTSYRDQLQKVQMECNFVQRFDPYEPGALDNILNLRDEHSKSQGTVVNAEAARSLIDMAGMRFPEFVDEVADLVELRDFNLTRSKVSLHNRTHEPFQC